ncbi:MAG: diguanylate cyclase [Phycisphaerae bacterium]
MQRRSRSLLLKLQAGLLMVFVLIIGTVLGVQVLLARASEHGAFHDHLSKLARVGLAAIELAPDRHSDVTRRERFRDWSWSVMADPAVRGAALLDAGSRVVALQPEDIADRRAIADAVAADAWDFDPGNGLGRLELAVAAAGGRQHVVVFAAPFRFSLLSGERWWASLLAGGSVAGAGWLWLRRRVVRLLIQPLRSLRRVVETGCPRPEDTPQNNRDDELGRLARAIERALDDRERSRDRVDVLERIMDQRVAARTRQIQAMLAQAERQAWIDPLTRLGNRRLLDDRLEPLYASQVECAEDMSIVVFDIDNFKQLNDTLGHAAGDELLSFTGELFRGALRSSDIGLRYGGDEFVAILLGSGSDEAAETADRLIKLFRQRASLYKVSLPVTMSAGVASIRTANSNSGGELLKLADAALYQSKRVGKGRVHVHRQDARKPTAVRVS